MYVEAFMRRAVGLSAEALAQPGTEPFGAVVVKDGKVVGIRLFGVRPDTLLGTLGIVGPWLKSQDLQGVAIYIAGFAILSGLALLPTYAQAIVGGWVFGFAVGVPAALLGFTGAALLGYGIARSVSHDKIEQKINANRRARAVRDALVGHGPVRTFFIVSLLRLPPNSPFAATNLVLASVRAPSTSTHASSTVSSTALSTTSVTGSATSTSTATVPVKVAASRSGARARS